jgi:hypothetical protein
MQKYCMGGKIRGMRGSMDKRCPTTIEWMKRCPTQIKKLEKHLATEVREEEEEVWTGNILLWKRVRFEKQVATDICA